jgi:hypothetical protein
LGGETDLVKKYGAELVRNDKGEIIGSDRTLENGDYERFERKGNLLYRVHPEMTPVIGKDGSFEFAYKVDKDSKKVLFDNKDGERSFVLPYALAEKLFNAFSSDISKSWNSLETEWDLRNTEKFDMDNLLEGHGDKTLGTLIGLFSSKAETLYEGFHLGTQLLKEELFKDRLGDSIRESSAGYFYSKDWNWKKQMLVSDLLDSESRWMRNENFDFRSPWKVTLTDQNLETMAIDYLEKRGVYEGVFENNQWELANDVAKKAVLSEYVRSNYQTLEKMDSLNTEEFKDLANQRIKNLIVSKFTQAKQMGDLSAGFVDEFLNSFNQDHFNEGFAKVMHYTMGGSDDMGRFIQDLSQHQNSIKLMHIENAFNTLTPGAIARVLQGESVPAFENAFKTALKTTRDFAHVKATWDQLAKSVFKLTDTPSPLVNQLKETAAKQIALDEAKITPVERTIDIRWKGPGSSGKTNVYNEIIQSLNERGIGYEESGARRGVDSRRITFTGSLEEIQKFDNEVLLQLQENWGKAIRNQSTSLLDTAGNVETKVKGPSSKTMEYVEYKAMEKLSAEDALRVGKVNSNVIKKITEAVKTSFGDVAETATKNAGDALSGGSLGVAEPAKSASINPFSNLKEFGAGVTLDFAVGAIVAGTEKWVSGDNLANREFAVELVTTLGKAVPSTVAGMAAGTAAGGKTPWGYFWGAVIGGGVGFGLDYFDNMGGGTVTEPLKESIRPYDYTVYFIDEEQM